MTKPISADQKTFNKSARHLLRQMKQSKADYFNQGLALCAYRGDGGLRCAAGILITNKTYEKYMEGKSAVNEMVSPVLRALGHKPTLVEELQTIHDVHQPNEWRGLLEVLARKFNLKMPRLTL